MKLTQQILIIMLVLTCAASYARQAKKQAGDSPTPIVLGNAYGLWSKELGENRTLNIYLPPGYNDHDTTRYPVIYLLDGGTDEDFIHVVGLVQFNSFEWIGRVPNSIVVGIVNVDRRRDYTYPTTVKADKEKWPTTGGSARFMSFVEKEVKPYVNTHFKTNGSSTLIGESLGGLFAAEVLLTKPALFDKYVIISPSLWWDNGSLLKKKADVQGRKTVYIGVGKEGLGLSEEPHVMEVDANVLKDNLEKMNNKNMEIFFDYLPNENHATVAHQALMDAFLCIYKRK